MHLKYMVKLTTKHPNLENSAKVASQLKINQKTVLSSILLDEANKQNKASRKKGGAVVWTTLVPFVTGWWQDQKLLG